MTTKQKIKMWLSSKRTPQTLTAIVEGADVRGESYGKAVGEMLRDGELKRTKKRRQVFKYEMARE